MGGIKRCTSPWRWITGQHQKVTWLESDRPLSHGDSRDFRLHGLAPGTRDPLKHCAVGDVGCAVDLRPDAPAIAIDHRQYATAVSRVDESHLVALAHVSQPVWRDMEDGARSGRWRRRGGAAR